jgi:hypothetical protein
MPPQTPLPNSGLPAALSHEPLPSDFFSHFYPSKTEGQGAPPGFMFWKEAALWNLDLSFPGWKRTQDQMHCTVQAWSLTSIGVYWAQVRWAQVGGTPPTHMEPPPTRSFSPKSLRQRTDHCLLLQCFRGRKPLMLTAFLLWPGPLHEFSYFTHNSTKKQHLPFLFFPPNLFLTKQLKFSQH